MGFSCMNGRLRRLPATLSPIPSTTTASLHVSKSDEREEDVSICNNQLSVSTQGLVSVIPFTLPSGIITTHQIPSLVISNKEGGNHNIDSEAFELTSTCSGKQYQHTEIPFMLYHLKQVHRLKGEFIVDHCWSIINECSSNEGDNNHDEMDKNYPLLVLAVLTRIGEDHEPEGAERNNKIRKNEGNEGAGAICTVFLYGRPFYEMREGEKTNPNRFNSYSVDCQGGETPSIFSLSHRIDLSYFVNGIAMDSNILVIGSFTGATIYDIQNVMSKAKANNNDNAQITNDCCNDNNEETLSSLHMMKSCIVQAMCISYPYFAAASGDRIGVWRVDDIVEHLRDQSIDMKTDDKGQVLLRNKRHLTAIWNTKVDNNQSRITCIGMTEGKNVGDILAISCWDGSAFVFERKINSKRDNPNRQQMSWVRVKPKVSSFRKTIGDDMTANLRSWEDPIIDSDVVFPTFLALSSINVGAKIRRLISVSCPGQKIARCYDIDAQEWVKDIGSYYCQSQDTSHQVHGMIAINSSFTNHSEQEENCTLLWIDNDDMIHECIL